jgi:FtsP/CotA-like multicopper oxidase with cupredoxin domain
LRKFIWFAAAAVSLPLLAHADELTDIVAARPCSSIAGDRVGASGNCSVTGSPHGLSVNLEPAGGSFSFKLPAGIALPGGTSTTASSSIAVSHLMLYNNAFTPEVWRILAGDTLQVKLHNKLPDSDLGATNLHTHGLLVSPDLDLTPDHHAIEPVGDSVFVCTIPDGATTTGASAAHCAMHGSVYGPDTARMAYALATRKDHPAGLYWYHPHVHFNARGQVGSGLSGLIYVKGSGPASGGTDPAPGETERFLMLKDVQLGSVAVDGGGAITGSFLPVGNHDASICSTTAPGATPLPGACFNSDGTGWLFTVNGQIQPTVTIQPGGREIWRIANTSADMTYDLALVTRDTGRPLRLQVLARDGVAAVPEGGKGPLMTERVLLMPGSRIEVGVDRVAAEGDFDETQPLSALLRTYGYFTGGSSGSGDTWPAVDLAHVEFLPQPAPPAATATAPAGRPVAARPAAVRPTFVARQTTPFEVRPWAPDASADKAPSGAHPGTPQTGAMVQAMMMQAHSHGGGTQPAGPDCTPLPPGEDRVIVLAISKPLGQPEDFKIGASKANVSDKTAMDAAIQDAFNSAAAFGDPKSPVICAHAGHDENWTIVNLIKEDNNENHNFHIHQMKYEVLAVDDPTGRVQPPLGGPKAHRKVDSYPVPIGGRLRIRIAFNKQMTGGRFVFHCHILEHEDKGMMAELQVVDP